MEIKEYHIIVGAGLLANLLYWGIEILEVGVSGIPNNFLASPLEHFFILFTLPTVFIIGYLFDSGERQKLELEEANRLKDLFTDILRHDIMNPVGIIKNVSELNLEDNPGDEDMEMILKNSKKTVELIESAAMLAKLEATEHFERVDLNLKEVIDEASTDLAPLFDEADMRLVNNIEDAMPIRANRIIMNVFLNLLSNAIKYTPEGKKVVLDGKDEEDTYRLSVTDFGGGISDDDKMGVFTRLVRKKKKGVKGSGLGLAIAKRIVELHGGEIWVEDNPDGGSIFFVSLPKE